MHKLKIGILLCLILFVLSQLYIAADVADFSTDSVSTIDPEKLTPTADRPKAYNMDEIRKRYDERYDTYVSTADHIIKEQDCAEKAADEILEVLS